jgi:hypothetical protein
MGFNEFLPSSKLLTSVGQFLCNEKAITSDICSNALFIIAGFDSQEFNEVSDKYQFVVKNL